jgi:ribosome-binding protein aMBF1 (putative translation factor)
MNQTNEYIGLCPLCYKPINTNESIETIKNDERQDIYHALCLREWATREEWIASNLTERKVVGEFMRGIREDFGISIQAMAKSLGISIARIKRFEKGEPVRDGKLIYSAYILKIYGDNTHRLYFDLYNQMYGADQPQIIQGDNGYRLTFQV